MKPRRPHKWTKDEKGLVIAALMFATLMLLVPKIMGATVDWPQPFVAPDYDSVHVFTKVNDGSGTFVQVDSSTCVIPCCTTVALNDTANWKIVTVWYSDGDSSYGGEGVLFSSNASVSLSGEGDNSVVVYSLCSGDTVSNVKYTVKNSSGVVEAVQTSTASGVDTLQLSNGTWEFIVKKHGYSSVSTDSAISANDTLCFTLTADGALTSPTSPTLANVYGYLIDNGGNAIEGALVTCNVSFDGVAVDTTTSKNIVWGGYSKGPDVTDSTGLFLFQVLRSSEYSNSDSVFYYLSAKYHEQKVFDAVRVYVPDTGNVNLGDTLAGRL